MERNSHTWREITSQPEVWRATLQAFAAERVALAEFRGRASFDRIAITGCGSTHYLAHAAAAVLAHRSGLPARPYPASEIWLRPDLLPPGRTLLLTISRSGTTTETLRALARFREAKGGPVLAITCHPESALTRQADLTLAAPAAQEQSIAQTRSFVSMLILAYALAATLADDTDTLAHLQRLPDALENLTAQLGDLPQRLGADPDVERFFFLGGGPFYGLACEAMLKMKEMTLSYAEAYHPLEFRHGPMSMVDGHTLVVGLLSDTALEQELRVLEDMRALGARTLALVEEGAPLAGEVLALHSGLDEWSRGPLYLPVLQRMACHRAVAKGLDPDRPANLSAVVELTEAEAKR